jgi:hypothetical protein
MDALVLEHTIVLKQDARGIDTTMPRGTSRSSSWSEQRTPIAVGRQRQAAVRENAAVRGTVASSRP